MVMEKEDTDDESLRIDCPVLVTERLVMRPLREDDLDDLVRLANNPRLASMLGRMPYPYGERDARDFLAFANRRDRAGCVYALALAETGTFIGMAELVAVDAGLVLGYWIGEPFWGKGYATEAAHALVDLAFRATEVEVLHASSRVINAASRAVIHKCGFQYAGQGMIHSRAAGRVPVENYRLDRRTWVSLRTWA